MPSIEVPEGFSYVLAAAASTLVLNLYQISNVGRARKAAGIPYPQAYAEKSEAAANKEAHRFNCCQRAHQNTLEHVPHALVGMLITGLKYPYLSAALGGTWVLGRFLYTVGYSSGDPVKRNSRGGFLSTLTVLGLTGSTIYTAYQFVMAGL